MVPFACPLGKTEISWTIPTQGDVHECFSAKPTGDVTGCCLTSKFAVAVAAANPLTTNAGHQARKVGRLSTKLISVFLQSLHVHPPNIHSGAHSAR